MQIVIDLLLHLNMKLSVLIVLRTIFPHQEVYQGNNRSDLVSEYNEVASQVGGSTIAQSTISRITDVTFQHQGIYNDNFYDLS